MHGQQNINIKMLLRMLTLLFVSIYIVDKYNVNRYSSSFTWSQNFALAMISLNLLCLWTCVS